jgi:prepilin-type N-terminal cleavage/methylation domain-containing protein
MKRGFTLVELLIVIGILAILAVVVVLVLNPAQLLAQARDSQRISDLGSIKSAIGLYLATATSPTLTATTTCTASGCSTGGPFGSESINSSTAVFGTGWVAIDLSSTTGGSPLSALPLDPTNSDLYFYAYKSDSTNKTFELDARLESTKYYGLMATDGGNRSTCSTYTESTCYYEIGTDPGLDL